MNPELGTRHPAPVIASSALKVRAVAQPGSVPEWGSGGRGFKSPLPDQNHPFETRSDAFMLRFSVQLLCHS